LWIKGGDLIENFDAIHLDVPILVPQVCSNLGDGCPVSGTSKFTRQFLVWDLIAAS